MFTKETENKKWTEKLDTRAQLKYVLVKKKKKGETEKFHPFFLSFLLGTWRNPSAKRREGVKESEGKRERKRERGGGIRKRRVENNLGAVSKTQRRPKL